MHELPVTQSILDIALVHAKANSVSKILSIHLEIGELSDLENEWIQRYFDYLSKGTVAEGAKLEIKRMPVVMQCPVCSKSFAVNIREVREIHCPDCGSKSCSLLSGREYYIKDMEVL
jgi:hydrogenase nickel incorporation protein HypA/HybF